MEINNVAHKINNFFWSTSLKINNFRIIYLQKVDFWDSKFDKGHVACVISFVMNSVGLPCDTCHTCVLRPLKASIGMMLRLQLLVGKCELFMPAHFRYFT